VRPLRLTYSLADQNFAQTKSIGILNLSLQLAGALARRPEFARLAVLTNGTLEEALELPAHVPVIHHNQAIAGRLSRLVWDQWGVYRAARRTGNGWLFLPKGFASFVCACPVDLATCVADANHDYYRRHYPNSVSPLESWYFRHSLRGTIKHSRIIFTISDFTRAEVARVAREEGLATPPVRTIGIGFRPLAGERQPKQNRLIVLVTPWPHKRSDLAVIFLERWQSQSRFPGTVEFVGRLPANLRLPGFPGWRHHQRMPEPTYRELLRGARALAYF
jgi:hypothetical protein